MQQRSTSSPSGFQKRTFLSYFRFNVSNTRRFSRGSWRHVASRAKRPLKSIVLDPGVKDLILNDARDFLQSKEWYSARGIPFRRGYLLVRT